MADDRDPEWTEADLELVQRLDVAGASVAEIARRLGRSEHAIRDHLPIVRARLGTPPTPRGGDNEEQGWFGPDEEGDVPPPSEGQQDKLAAWVHNDPGRE
ncbi:helix-turn-helix transcriptional regulator [Rhizorhabdus argentea]|uniref:helix-turn-helix transcriptional regulator n=1 Tax=Rhizorhabdus argentea TaxID=1387174 RepID=UPI0030EE25AC